MNGISNHISNKLESLGIIVKGEKVVDNFTSYDSSSDSRCSESEFSDEDEIHKDPTSNFNITDLTTKNISNIPKVNLDVSAMLAYCSSVTNGSAHLYDFSVPVLKQQAEWERLRPQKPILDNFFKGNDTNIKFSILLFFTSLKNWISLF